MTKFSKISTYAIALIALSQPALAADEKSGGASTAGASIGTAAASTDKPRKAKKYCFLIGAETGSRLGRETCRTQQEWEANGYDINKRK